MLIKSQATNCHLHCVYVITYLLTPWSRVLLEKLTGFAANQETPHNLWNLKVHYRTHKHPRVYVIASGKSATEVNTGLLTYPTLCMAELFSLCWVQCAYGFGVVMGCQVKVKFCSDRNVINTSDVQGVLRSITCLGMIVCCCNVTFTADGLKLKHRRMRTVCGRCRKLIALKVSVTGAHILGWQKCSNSCVNTDRNVYRSWAQWGKHLTTHHTQQMENIGNHITLHLVHTNTIVPNDLCPSVVWGHVVWEHTTEIPI